MQTAQRLQALPAHFFASLGARISALQAQGLDVIRLDEGSPDFPAPGLSTPWRSARSHHTELPAPPRRGIAPAWAKMYQTAYGVV
jgi:hypothetical protein